MKDTFQTFDVAAVLQSLPHLDLNTAVTDASHIGESFRILAPFGSGGLVVGGFTGLTPWERQPDNDELLYAVEGEAEITILTDEGTTHGVLHQGHACVVPKGHWHRQLSHTGVKLLAISGPADHASSANDPREPESEELDGD